MIEHMVKVCEDLYNNVEYEVNQWYFYHDTLSLMTAKETKKWMEEKGYLKHWLLPQCDINIGTTYHEKPCGNVPYFNPLDNSLFKDNKFGHRNHFAGTTYDEITDPNLMQIKSKVEYESRKW